MKPYLTIIFLVLSLSSYSQTTCDSINISNRKNLGIFGGVPFDLKYLNSNNRLFATVKGPYSLFYTDDTCHTWKAAYPVDSLYYDCGNKGWGGGGQQIVTNEKGWVLVHNEDPGSNLSSVVVNQNAGKVNDWKNITDNELFLDSGYSYAISLNDYYAYIGFHDKFLLYDSGKIDTSNLFKLENNYSGLPDLEIINITAANNPSGFPIYLAVDTFEISLNPNILLKFDGTNYTQLSLPTNTKDIISLYSHPQKTNGDTLFISVHLNTQKTEMYRTFDEGDTWENISPTKSITSNIISDVAYSKGWETLFPQSEGVILMIAVQAYSTDFGSTWNYWEGDELILQNAMAIHPLDTSTIIGCSPENIMISHTGIKGGFIEPRNANFEAISIRDIDRSKNKGVFYLATMSGLAYTSAYLNDTIDDIQKWRSPNGVFPVGGDSNKFQYSAVAIDPWDSLHVVAGFSETTSAKGFSTTFTGVTGFFNYEIPFSFNETSISDIEFVTSDIVLATTFTEFPNSSSYGEIYRSDDGGISWNKVTPVGFSIGNALEVGYSKSDTVVYAGTGYMNKSQGVLWKSTDLGLNWTAINQGPVGYTDSSYNALPILDIAIDPRGTDTLYLACGDHKEKIDAWVKSEDGGNTYEHISVSGAIVFSSVKVHPQKPDSLVFASNGRDIFCYIPVMDTVFHVYRGLPGEEIPTINIGSLLCGTSTGFYSLDLETIDDIIVKGIKNTPSLNEPIEIYPNPTNSFLYLNVRSETINEISIKIKDLTGNDINVNTRELANGKFALDCNSLSSGLYFISMTINSNNYTRKVIIVH